MCLAFKDVLLHTRNLLAILFLDPLAAKRGAILGRVHTRKNDGWNELWYG